MRVILANIWLRTDRVVALKFEFVFKAVVLSIGVSNYILSSLAIPPSQCSIDTTKSEA